MTCRFARSILTGLCSALLVAEGSRVRRVGVDSGDIDSSASGASAGNACIGGWFSSGDCGKESVELEDGTVKTIQLYCYAPTPLDLRAKARSGSAGTCYVPRKKSCTSDDQCRPGTVCKTSNSGGSQLLCLDDTYVNPLVTLEDGLRLVRVNLDSAASAISRLGNSQAQDGFDKMSGLWSPLFLEGAYHISDRDVLMQNVKLSFESGAFKDMGETSRSGATFMWSGDRRFIAKTVRPGEFETWCQDILPHLGVLLNLGRPCEEEEESCSWAMRTLNATTINVPILGFRHEASYFLVLPVTSQLRQAAKVHGLGAPTFFDVKPLAAHSHQRVSFLRWLRDHDATPNSANDPVAQRQWAALSTLLERDIEFLKEHDIIDYSFLVEAYDHATITQPGSQCVALHDSKDGSKGGRVLCINIIDYTLKYDTIWKTIESRIIRQKWDDYDGKARLLTNCIGNLGLGSQIHGNPGKITFKFDIEHQQYNFSARSSEDHKSYEVWKRCEAYGNLACGDFLDDISRSAKGYRTSYSGCTHSTAANYMRHVMALCEKASCKVNVGSDSQGRTRFCRHAMVSPCEDKLARDTARDNLIAGFAIMSHR